ncbi:MAG: ATP-dependent DNA helicase RecQ, partial [Microbacteriaceae bacterium]|nr:ATP-dependent DNA helicase RecQ [Microbacteriaceae bacterium]
QGEWGVLAPTEAAKPVLRGEQQVMMREEVVARSAARRPSSAKKTATADLSEDQAATFERLREWRLGEAREQGVPPYVVFGDATLRALAVHRPASRDALRGISGIGDAKLERYGDAVLAILA